MTKEEINKKLISLVLVILVLILGVYKIFFSKDNMSKEKIDTEKISVVEDNSRFFTVSSCVSKYLRYISEKNTENILLLLTSEYKTKNSINSSNLYNYIENIDYNPTFDAKKMFEQRLSQTVYKYYVYGYIEENLMDDYFNKQPYYLIVILDESNLTFAVEPYDGSMFK